MVTRLLEQLDAISALPFAVKLPGWRLPLTERPPELDQARPASAYVGALAIDLKPPPACVAGCANYFPAGGGMDWHTDSHRPGWRLYAYRMLSGEGRFHYGDRVVIERWPGAYVFETGPECWHAIEARGPRLSCGIKIPEAIAKELIG